MNVPWWLYIIRTDKGTLYTGITNDLKNRWQMHLDGKGAKYFRSAKPEAMVYIEACADRSAASKREAEVKKLNVKEKHALVAAHDLSQPINEILQG